MLVTHKNMLKRGNSSWQKLKSIKNPQTRYGLFRIYPTRDPRTRAGPSCNHGGLGSIKIINSWTERRCMNLHIQLCSKIDLFNFLEMYDPDNHFAGGCSDNCAVLDSNIHIKLVCNSFQFT